MESIRLNKLLARRLGASRRAADELISSGNVKINAVTAELGAQAGESDHITVHGKSLPKEQSFRYVLLNKPVGYVCSRQQQGATPTIYELLPRDMQRLKIVGRLDKDSSGLVLLTDDGDLAQQLTHPRHGKTKRSEVVLDKPLAPLHRQMIEDHGIQVGDYTSRLQLEKHDDNNTEWYVTMREGRNRQIRRTFAALGYEVARLHRIQLGNMQLSGLQPGSIRELSHITLH